MIEKKVLKKLLTIFFIGIGLSWSPISVSDSRFQSHRSDCGNFDLEERLMETIAKFEHAKSTIEQVPISDLQKSQFIANLRSAAAYIQGIDFNCYSDQHLAQKGLEIFEQIFRLRFDLDLELKEWSRKGLLEDQEVRSAAHQLLRYSRYADEILGEILVALNYIDPQSLSSVAFDQQTAKIKAISETTENQGAQKDSVQQIQTIGLENFEDIKDGDLILFRGDSSISAAIARITDNPSIWSHIGIYSQGYIAEALIEKGLTATPWSKARDNNLSRVAIYRLKSLPSSLNSMNIQTCASQAGQHLLDRARTSDAGRPSVSRGFVPYNFTMNMNSPRSSSSGEFEELFCSQAVAEAFQIGCNSLDWNFPKYPSDLNPKNRDFISQIGVPQHVIQTFAPADIQLDPHFELVAEWRDFRKTANTRIQDIVLDVIYETMNEKGWKLWDNGDVLFKTAIIRGVTRFGPFNRLVEAITGSEIPPNIARRAMGGVLMIDETAKLLSQKIIEANKRAMSRTENPRPLHPLEIEENLRQEIWNSTTESAGPYLGRYPQLSQ